MSAVAHAADTGRAASRGAIVAAVIGNWLELFDFTVFGFFAVVIGRLYFPSAEPTTSLLLSVATFAVGFITRPLGGMMLGVYADRKGRKAALTLTLMLMAIGTGLIAVAPTYGQIGVAAPLLIVFARLIQGFSQGGEFAAATAILLERGDVAQRGFRASWQLAAQGGAALTGSGIAAALSAALPEESLETWGWRVPFVIGVLIAPVGVYLRRRLADDNPGAHLAMEQGVLRELFTQNLRTLVLVTLSGMGGAVSSYILTFYMPTYAIHSLGLPMSLSMLVGVAAGLVVLTTSPLFGLLSDRLRSRKRPILAARGVLILLLCPAFILMNRFPKLSVVIPLTALMMVFYSMGSTAGIALMCESFPRHVRATGISITYAFSVCAFGGTAQFVATCLLRATGSTLAPAAYVAGCLAVSLIAVSMLRETADRAID